MGNLFPAVAAWAAMVVLAPGDTPDPLAALNGYRGRWVWTADWTEAGKTSDFGHGRDVVEPVVKGAALRLTSTGFQAGVDCGAEILMSWDAQTKTYVHYMVSTLHLGGMLRHGHLSDDGRTLVLDKVHYTDPNGRAMEVSTDMGLPQDGSFEIRLEFKLVDGPVQSTLVYRYRQATD
ncbi:MAG: DUF1579 family protein [Armatimonadetes bacterium]|nr:DUF1579 family protein [Armatimonadota bacterium]